jgi:hypothetical protein
MRVERVSRRELLQRAGAVAATTALSGFALEEGVAKPINEAAAATRPAFEWIRSARLMIGEGYAPPFCPSLDYEAEKALALAHRLNRAALRYPTFLKWHSSPPRPGFHAIQSRDRATPSGTR